MLNHRNLLTTGQAAELCSVTPDTVLKWIKKGRLSVLRTAGGHYRIEQRDLERLIDGPAECTSQGRRLPDDDPRKLRCWEYLSIRGVVRDECRRCVVYSVLATRCFLLAGMEADVGHARTFCEGSCEDCVFYRRVKGLATNVLLITSDEQLMEELGREENEGITLRFARNAYEASAVIQGFRPAVAVVDVASVANGDTELLDSLANDSRLPGLRVTLVVPPGTKRRRGRSSQSDLFVSIVERPQESGRIAAVINGIAVDPLLREDGDA